MQMAIASYPHLKKEDQKALPDMLNKIEIEMANEEEKERKEEFDQSGFERLKAAMGANPRIVVK